VLVIDDDSEDNTLEIAGAIPGVTVLRAPKLEKRQHGFTGKKQCSVVWSETMLMHMPQSGCCLRMQIHCMSRNSLHHAITEAERHSLALLSYSAKQLTTGLLQRALMPLIFSRAGEYVSTEEDCRSEESGCCGKWTVSVDESGGVLRVGDTRLLPTVSWRMWLWRGW